MGPVGPAGPTGMRGKSCEEVFCIGLENEYSKFPHQEKQESKAPPENVPIMTPTILNPGHLVNFYKLTLEQNIFTNQ